jgi:hypothetical protein
MTRRNVIILALAAVAGSTAWALRGQIGAAFGAIGRGKAKFTVEDRLRQFGAASRARWEADARKAGLLYPPQRVVLLVLKQEREVQVYGTLNGRTKWMRNIPVLAASGKAGPKLREGDQQVPEGVYNITELNPNSSYHVSMRVDYPNEFDREQALKEGRKKLGGDIMIHGRDVSIGCVAVGDQAAEDLFTLTADVGVGNVAAVIVPQDLRKLAGNPKPAGAPPWLDGLYTALRQIMGGLPPPR